MLARELGVVAQRDVGCVPLERRRDDPAGCDDEVRGRDRRERLAVDCVGVEPLPERGRAHHVGEERGEDLALLTDGGRHG